MFLEDYDMSVARYLVQGADVWLNTPRRPNEASGTSGMKLLANGGLNLSVLDGWWDEAYDREVGWAIGSGEESIRDRGYQDQVESEALYNLLENDVVPLFYDRDSGDIPRGLAGQDEGVDEETFADLQHQPDGRRIRRAFLSPGQRRHLRLSGR